MQELFVVIPTPDGGMETFVTHPEEGAPFPPVVVFMDIWGAREELFDIARRIATVGYYAMVPDFYYRQGRVRNEFRDAHNRMVSLHLLDEEKTRKVFVPRHKLSNDMVISDTGALLAFIDGEAAARPGAVGSVGYCMGGTFVMLIAGHYPERFQASASLHGTAMITGEGDSPHLLAERFRGELYCGFGEHDPYTPPQLVEQMETLFQSCPVDYRYAVHPGAEHGYALPDRDIHDRRAVARDWEMIFAMFHRRIPAYAP